MPAIANIAPNIKNTQTQNFSFDIVFSPPPDVDIDSNSFTLSNIKISNSDHVSKSNIELISFANNVGVVTVILEPEVSGSFIVELTGTVMLENTLEQIISKPKKIEYDTITKIRVVIG